MENMEDEYMEGWFFAPSGLRLGYGDKREIILGETHTIRGEFDKYTNALYASEQIIDALHQCPAYVCRSLFRVKLSGRIADITVDITNQACASERTYLEHFDITPVLSDFLDFLIPGDKAFQRKVITAARGNTWLAAKIASWWSIAGRETNLSVSDIAKRYFSESAHTFAWFDPQVRDEMNRQDDWWLSRIQQCEPTNPVPPRPAKSSKVAGRNDPCPCGSGVKYKKCCGK